MDEERPIFGAQGEFERSKTISELQKAIDAGLDSGPVVSLDPELFKRNTRIPRN